MAYWQQVLDTTEVRTLSVQAGHIICPAHQVMSLSEADGVSPYGASYPWTLWDGACARHGTHIV